MNQRNQISSDSQIALILLSVFVIASAMTAIIFEAFFLAWKLETLMQPLTNIGT